MGVLRTWTPAVLFLGLCAAYVAPGRPMWGADTLPNRYLPIAILRHGTFYLDRVAEKGAEWEQWRRDVNGHAVSDYPVGTALLAVPIYLPLVLGGLDFDSAGLDRVENLAGAVLAALAAVVFYFVLLRLTDPIAAVVLALIAGLGTSTMSTNAHGLWPHNGVQLAVAAALYCLVRGRAERVWLARAALPLGFAVLLARPQSAPLVAPLAVYALLQRPGLLRCGLWAAPVIAFFLWYNLTYFGGPVRSQFPLDPGMFSTPLAEGLHGVLLSPWKGLFVYSPIFALSLVGAALAWRPGGDGLLRALGLGVGLSVLLYAKWMFWNGGATAGPRILGDLAIPLTMLLLPVVPWVRGSRMAMAASGLLVTVAVVSHGVVAWRSFEHRDMNEFNERLWLWRYHPIVATITPPSRPRTDPPEPFIVGLARAGGARPTSQDGSAVRLRTNAARFRTGDRLALGLAVETPPSAPLRDLYVGAYVAAFQTVAFFPGRQLLSTQIPVDRREWFARLLAVPGGAVLDDRDFFSVTVFHHLARATYHFFAVLVEPRSSPWRVVAADGAGVVVE